MPYPTAFFIHSVTIRHATGETTDDGHGGLIPVTEDTVSVCRLSTQTETIKVSGQSTYLTSTPKIALPPATVIQEKDQIISTVTGYTGTFTVNQVKAVYEATRETISHYTCLLSAVV
jgi:hypothetical protein